MADQQEDRSLRPEIKEFTYQPDIDSKSDVRNALLVVATLIVAVTFQAGLNPPGGVWQDNSPTPTQGSTQSPEASPPTQGSMITQPHEAGKAILGSNNVAFNKVAFTIFLFSNTAALSTSSFVIVYLVQGFPFQGMVQISLFFMNFTYGFSIGAVQPEGIHNFPIMFFAFILPFIWAMARHI
ncbi:putative PGG domain-containing protein [Fagus crenata]